ncbi:MAG TPA: PepSY-like domain-containing protein [Verrucomicrobiae bacterium]|nr:PepSY-like domain-containing protein [Verrucomicrobiae bacterium]
MAVTVFADDQSQTVKLSETPAAVQKTVQAQINGGQLGEIDAETNGEEIVYDVELTGTNDEERDFSVADDGTLLSVEIPFAETPAPVQKAIQTLIKQGELESIDKNLDDSEIAYDIELAAKDGREKDFTIADDGTLLSEEVSLTETPDVVQKTIASQLNGGKVENIGKNFDDDGINYDVEITTKDNSEKSFTVAENGKLSSVQVTLEEIPRPVQKTIRNQIGDDKVLEIDRSFVQKNGVFPYEIQGRKNGKPFDFSVGPRGRFLGMDE